MHLIIKNASVTLNGNTILEEVNFEVKDRQKIAIVGKNGAGKTTLLKALVDNDLFESGIGEEKFSISCMGTYNIGYLKQMAFEDENITLMAEILKSFADLIKMERQLETYVTKMNNHSSESLIQEYSDLQERFRLLGGYSYQKEYEVMLNKFGFTESDKQKPLREFSGGQKTKIAFIKLLLSKPDLLLLDEPTNHLDIKTIEWLENYLKNYPAALILVSHDRMFIDKIVDTIYDIDYGKTVEYSGNFAFYEKTKRINYEHQMRDYNLQQKEIKRLYSIYERFRNKPSKARMAMSKLHQIEKMDLIDKPNDIEAKTFRTNLQEIEPSVKNVLRLKDVEIGYDHPLAKVSFELIRGKKIAIIGENGIGKSTLLKTIQGIIEPLSGSIEYGLRVNPGYFDQNLAMADSHQTVLAEFMSFLPNLNQEEARRALGSFLFKGDDVLKSVSVLSGGEKVRLQLCKILYNKPNLLLLDEPTNHMDIVGKEHLEDILESYPGSIIFVSHDRYFIKKIADELIVFEDGKVNYYHFGYLDYLEKIKNQTVDKEYHEHKEKILKQHIAETVNEASLYTLEKDLNKLENEIIKIETNIKSLEKQLFSEENINNYQKINKLNENIKNLNIQLDELNGKWEELTDLIMATKKDAN